VETGSTLKANGLVEIEEICKVSTRLAINRSFLKTNSSTIQPWIDKVGQVIND
jgi:ATP phosphoribosyltransferase